VLTLFGGCACCSVLTCCLQLFILRKFIEYELAQINLNSDEVYFCSLSSATVVYKGQLTPEQVGGGKGVEFKGTCPWRYHQQQLSVVCVHMTCVVPQPTHLLLLGSHAAPSPYMAPCSGGVSP
jgi:hypothetical protein